MILLFSLGCIIATIFIVYNIMCYKNKKSIYMLSDKYAILNSHYYTIQLILGLCNSFLLLIFYIAWYIFSKNEFLFIILTPIIFWGLNYILEFYSRKKGYIGAKENKNIFVEIPYYLMLNMRYFLVCYSKIRRSICITKSNAMGHWILLFTKDTF